MGAALASCIATTAASCCCTATTSLLGACCGNDKASSVPPSARSGRKRSVALLVLTVGIALGFQYGLAPFIVSDVPVSNYVTNAWTDGCDESFSDSQVLREKCAGNNGVYRATSSTFLFFLLAGAIAFCKPTANREAWVAKVFLYLFLVLGTCFIPNKPVFGDIFLHLARILSIFFVIFQQVILLDLAYNWNEAWVEKSNQGETEKEQKRWLGAILASCGVLFTTSFVCIVLLFVYFGGCTTNDTFISLTLILSVVVTVLQLTGEDASLLSSAVVVIYGTYLCYTAVSKNPDGTCNPFLGDEDILDIVLGIVFVVISMGWTGFSYTAESRVSSSGDLKENLAEDQGAAPTPGTPNETEDGGRKVTGVVTGPSSGQDYGSTTTPEETAARQDDNYDGATPAKPVSWKLNIILALISCYVAMVLTGWGSIEAGGDPANPDVSRVSMWMIIASQWIMYLLYGWTLVAPRLFPDRDFS